MSTFNTGGSVVSQPNSGLLTQGIIGNNKQPFYSSAIQKPFDPLGTGTPLGTAKNFISGLFTPPAQTPMASSSSNFTNNFGTNTGLIPQHNAPTTSVKSLTTKPDGSTTSTYHAPTTLAPDDPSHMYRTDNGQINTNYVDPVSGKKADDPSNQYNTITGALNPNYQSPTIGNQASPANVGNTVASQIPNVGGAGAYTQPEQTAQQTLQGQAIQPSAAYNQGMENYNAAKTALADYNKNLTETNKNINAQGISLDSARGQQANVGQAATAEEAALQGAVTNASNILGAANTQQGLQVQAGTAAGGIAQNQAQRNLAAQEGVLGAVQPQPYGVTTTPYSPATGEFGQIAGNAASGGNGLQGVGNIQEQIGIGRNIAQLNSYLGGANVVGNNLNDLITQNNINPAGLSYANGAIQFGAKQLSNPAYQKFAGQINDFVASLAPILGVGGSSTDMKTQMSSQIVNALQSGQSIKDVVSYFLDQAQQKIKGLSAGGGAPVGSASANAGTPTGTVSAGGYNFVQDAQGNWVAK